MVYTETGIFKRYIRNRKGKEVTQVGVSGLSVNSQFKDNEEIIILSKEDYTQLETQLNTNEDKIHELETQLKTVTSQLETLENTHNDHPTETPKYINKVIDLQEEINNRNELLFNTQNTINHIINEATSNYNTLSNEVTTANNTTKENIIKLISDLQTQINTILEYYHELPNQVNGINNSIDNTSWFKWIRSKNKFKIVMDMDKLTELESKLIEFTSTDIVQIANELITPMEIPTDNLTELASNDLDLTELYISIDNDKSSNEIVIDPKPKK